jgi:hypothetical protein
LDTDQKVTCTWDEDVGPGDDKVVQLTAIANKAGSYVNRATVLTNMTGVTNKTSNATVVIVEVSGALLRWYWQRCLSTLQLMIAVAGLQTTQAACYVGTNATAPIVLARLAYTLQLQQH